MITELATDPVDVWLRDSKSERSKKARKVILDRFLEYEKTTVSELFKIAGTVYQGPNQHQTEINESIARYAKTRKEHDRAGSTVAKEVGVIVGFFRANWFHVEPPPGLSLKPRYEKHKRLEKVDVEHMLSKVSSKPYEQAVILTLAQTGQPLRILSALSWGESKHKQTLPVINESHGWGFVEIDSDMRNWLNQPINRTNAKYSFFIHPECMGKLHKIHDLNPNEDRVFIIHPRHMQEIVQRAATAARIQKATTRQLNGAKWYDVHADIFRPYWKRRMKAAGVDDGDLLRYLTGQKVTIDSEEVQKDALLEKYKKAEKSLSLLQNLHGK